jgi:hypothetical protein
MMSGGYVLSMTARSKDRSVEAFLLLAFFCESAIFPIYKER